MFNWMIRVIFDVSVVAEIGRACLVEMGARSRWWARMRHLCHKFGMEDLLNLICVADMSVKGLENMNMCTSKKVWEARVNEKVCKIGCDRWTEGFSGSERESRSICLKRRDQ